MTASLKTMKLKLNHFSVQYFLSCGNLYKIGTVIKILDINFPLVCKFIKAGNCSAENIDDLKMNHLIVIFSR